MTHVCRRCKAPILWAKTERGKAMPLDPDPVADGNVALADGIAVTLTHAALERLAGSRELYRSHFASCPYAEEFRR